MLDIEAGFVDDPADSGGATMYGITERVARADGYTGPMRELPLDRARDIYKRKYYNLLRLDQIASLSPAIAMKMMDIGVNTGISVAAISLQRVLNVSNDRGRHYPDIAVDGALGAKTLAALAAYLKKRGNEGKRNMVKALNCLQGAYYVALVESREKDERFFYGWLAKRIG